MPAPLADQQQIDLIVREVAAGTGDPKDLDPALVSAYWRDWAGKAAISRRLRRLYTKRSACESLEGRLRLSVDLEQPDVLQAKVSQKLTAVQAMIAECTREIVRLEQRHQRSRMGASAPLIHTAPAAPPAWAAAAGLDANDPAYTGSPYDARLDDWTVGGIEP